MGRRTQVLRLASAAVLGAATTVGVAWALARWLPVPPYPRTTLRAFIVNGRAWSTTEVRLWGAHDIWWMDLEFDARQRAAQGPATALDLIVPIPPQEQCVQLRANYAELARQRPGTVALELPPSWGSFTDPASLPTLDKSGNDAAFGLPMPCLWYRVIGQMKGNLTFGGPVEGGILVSGQASSRGTGNYRALPLRPIWPALAVDWLTFAIVWWLLMMAPGAARRAIRRRRIRRGACPHCAYDLRGLAPGALCPECGSAIAPYGTGAGTAG